ncbi:MAG: butyrate kinase [Gemmatimonadota bacterium]|nr:butyrate kinase [Gemmatimonadota bacterium]
MTVVEGDRMDTPVDADDDRPLVLAVNPGSTSTRVALFRDAPGGPRPEADVELRHDRESLASVSLWGQLPLRRSVALEFLAREGVEPGGLAAVAGRGGLLHPVEGGVYEVSDAMLRDAKAGVQGRHPANLGAPLARDIAARMGGRAFVVDPVSVDEFAPEARLSGHEALPRRSLSHALSVRSAVRTLAGELGRPWREVRAVVAHLGGGVSVCPVRDGRIVDANNAVSEGPFSPQRSGGLPVQELLDLVYAGARSEAEVRRMTVGGGGFVSYLGTDDLAAVERRRAAGDDEADLVLRAFVYQVAKEIGAMATVLEGRLDAVVLTGGMARSERMTEEIAARTGFLAPVRVIPVGEMRALAEGALAVLRGEEDARVY